MNSNAQLRAVHAKRQPSSADPLYVSQQLEQKWFAFDRSTVLRQIDSTRTAIGEFANELEMVGAERVFEKPVSDILFRMSRRLKSIGRDLRAMQAAVTRAKGYERAD
jgi:hypothetical protein